MNDMIDRAPPDGGERMSGPHCLDPHPCESCWCHDDLDRLATEAVECGDVCDKAGCVTCDPEAQDGNTP